ncbi:tyrosine-type recombinase/integrase [Serratia ureilytica]|uniref:phage integrase n=1 Tax=Serratia ureilytica TaxID=300181 RepID=UPI003716A1D4
MSIIKLDNGQYRVDLRPHGRNGKRIRKTFATRGEALRFERHTLATEGVKPWQDQPKDKRPLSELITLWWQYHGQNLKSGDADLRRLKKMNAALGAPCAHEVSKSLFTDYRLMRTSEGVTAATLNREQAMLSSVFTVLIKAGKFHGTHPLAGLEKAKSRARHMSFLSKTEIRALLAHLTGDNRKAAMLCLATGARWGEASALQRENLIKFKVTYVDTKNGKNRTVPIDTALYAQLADSTGRKLLPGADYLQVREALKAIAPDLPKGQAVHVLRHTFASHFMMNGGNILALQKILGHATIEQTMTYAHLSPDYLQDAVKLNPLSGLEAGDE